MKKAKLYRHWAFALLSSIALLCLLSTPSTAQQDTGKTPRILILLDGSSSMVEPWDASNKRYQEAAQFITRLMDSLRRINPDVEFALRVFGHQYGVPENNCYDTKLEVRFSKDNFTQMKLRLADIKPYGVSPIAYSLKEAATYDLERLDKYYYSLVLITDGGESCKGDICDVVRKLINQKIFFKPYIVSLIDYAPLKQQYECLGTLLTAPNEQGVTNSIEVLVDAHRKMFKVVKQTPSILKPTTEPPVVVKKELPPPPTPPKNATTSLGTIAARRAISTFPWYRISPGKAKTISYVVKYPLVKSSDWPIEKPIAPRPATPSLSTLRHRSKINLIPTIYGTVNPKPRGYKVNYPLVRASQFADDKPAVANNTPKPTPPKPTPPKPAPPKPPVKKEQIKEAPFVKETEESAETELYIYFSDGKGKYYKTEPQVSLSDAQTNKPVKTFYRTVNKKNGEPDAINIAPGVYNLLVIGRANTYVRRLVVDEGKKTKLNIIVGKGSLKFEYAGNPKRPMTEYRALVNRRFAPGPTVTQNAADILEYEPGTYYAEVNTYPVHKAAFEIGFDELLTISVPEPGIVHFTNTNNVGKVTLWMPLGDAYVQFGQVIVEGREELQLLDIQPGVYEARYKKNPNLPYEKDTIVPFRVYSNKQTEVSLP